MKILLVTRNHVVREFVELVTDRLGAALDVVQHISEVQKRPYDFFFLDDRGEVLEESLSLLPRLEVQQAVVLYSEPNPLHASFDQKIKKPFLPSDIQALLETHVLQPSMALEDQVLNIQDIEEIRGLLENEGLEIVSEETLADALSKEEEMTKRGVSGSVEERLLAAIVKMEPKKIRKLLKGAEFTLTIKFPEEKQ